MRAIAIAALVLVASCDRGKQTKPIVNKRAPADAAVTTTEDCDLLLGHLVDLEFATANAAASTETMRQEIAKQRAAVIEAKRDEFRHNCLTVRRDQVMCALAATDSAGVDRCDVEPAHSR